MDNGRAYLSDRNSKLQKEFEQANDAVRCRQRFEKIMTATGVIDVGDITRLAFWKSQARRDPGIMQGAQKNFADIDRTLAEGGLAPATAVITGAATGS
jgi:hypothetical protein